MHELIKLMISLQIIISLSPMHERWGFDTSVDNTQYKSEDEDSLKQSQQRINTKVEIGFFVFWGIMSINTKL